MPYVQPPWTSHKNHKNPPSRNSTLAHVLRKQKNGKNTVVYWEGGSGRAEGRDFFWLCKAGVGVGCSSFWKKPRPSASQLQQLPMFTPKSSPQRGPVGLSYVATRRTVVDLTKSLLICKFASSIKKVRKGQSHASRRPFVCACQGESHHLDIPSKASCSVS